MLKTVKHQYLAILWSIIILVLCNMPMSGERNIPLFEGFDKIVHLGFFFVLTVLLFFGKIKQQLNYSYRVKTIIKIFFITTLLGGGIELLQLKVFTYRGAEWFDFFADLTGSAMGIFSYILLHNHKFNETIMCRTHKPT